MRINSPLKKTVLFFILVLLLICVGFWAYSKKSSSYSLPEDVKSQISGFQPYYLPKDYSLPDDLIVDKNSIRYEADTLLFNLQTPDNKTINISEQPVPEEFNSEGGSFIGKETFDTTNGKVTLSFVDGRTSAFLITNQQDAFIILSSSQPITADTIRVILSSLEKV